MTESSFVPPKQWPILDRVAEAHFLANQLPNDQLLPWPELSEGVRRPHYAAARAYLAMADAHREWQREQNRERQRELAAAMDRAVARINSTPPTTDPRRMPFWRRVALAAGRAR